MRAWVKIKGMTGKTEVENVTSVAMDESTIRIQYRVDKMPAEYHDQRERLESLEIEP